MKKKNNSIYKLLSNIFLAISIGMVLFVAYFTFSRATVILTPEKISKTASVKITIDAEKDAIDLENYIMPGSLAAQNFEKTYSDILIERKDLSQKAAGKVTIYNKRPISQFLLVESQLQGKRNPQMIFFTDKAVTVPANGSVEMEITAKEAGIEGNIPAQRFDFIKLSPSMQALVYAESSDFTRGGFSEGYILTQEDINKAIENNRENFFISLRNEALKNLESSSKIIRAELSEEKITETSTNIQIGQTFERFDLTIKGELKAIAFNESHIISITASELKNQASETEEFIKPGQIRYMKAEADWESASAIIETEMDGSFLSKISPSLLQKETLIGLAKDEAVEYLQNFPEISTAEIHFFPPWNSTIPGGLKSSIKIEVKNEF